MRAVSGWAHLPFNRLLARRYHPKRLAQRGKTGIGRISQVAIRFAIAISSIHQPWRLDECLALMSFGESLPFFLFPHSHFHILSSAGRIEQTVPIESVPSDWREPAGPSKSSVYLVQGQTGNSKEKSGTPHKNLIFMQFSRSWAQFHQISLLAWPTDIILPL